MPRWCCAWHTTWHAWSRVLHTPRGWGPKATRTWHAWSRHTRHRRPHTRHTWTRRAWRVAWATHTWTRWAWRHSTKRRRASSWHSCRKIDSVTRTLLLPCSVNWTMICRQHSVGVRPESLQSNPRGRKIAQCNQTLSKGDTLADICWCPACFKSLAVRST